MPEETTPNIQSQSPVGVAPAQTPVAPEANVNVVPQNQDKSDAMTYPLGSQNVQPVAPVEEEDHRSILDRIMGIFSKGKKPEDSQAPQAPQMPGTPTPPVQS